MVRRIFFLTMMIMGSVTMTFCGNPNDNPDKQVREPGVAGTFYPADASDLKNMVSSLLRQAEPAEIKGTIIGLISPHAGYVYSGQVAAYSYKLLGGKPIRRVVIISPSHIAAFKGAAVYNGDIYRTPLGDLLVDKDFCTNLAAKNDLIQLSSEGHETIRQGRMEHALEVQLPFLQTVLKDFKIVPVIMGDQDYDTGRALGIALSELITDDKTVIIASSDLSHFHPYEEAVTMDKKVINGVMEWDHINLSRNLNQRVWEACGGGPIVATMIAAERLGGNKAELLKYANSGDVPVGEKTSVVGYMAAVLYKDPAVQPGAGFSFELNNDAQNHLLKIARGAVETAVNENKIFACSAENYPALQSDRGAFVTLNISGQLRGCIGYISASQPLWETVRSAAISAALKDPRFPAVSKAELTELSYEISVLSPFHRIAGIQQIEVGKHGLMIRKGQYQGLLLPQVATDNHWDALTFLEQTCRKAGLPANAWKDAETDIFVFSAFVFPEGH